MSFEPDNPNPVHDPAQIPEEIVTQPQQLAEVCARLAAGGEVGFDTEFVGEDTYHPRLCLVQVATAERLYLIDPLSAGPLDAFWSLVLDPAVRVIVHAGREEVRLCRLWTGRTPRHFFDLQVAAGLVGMGYPLGHGPLVNQLMRVQLAKAETLTEWRQRPLTRAQIRYAFDDVRYLLPCHRKLHGRLENLGRLDWAREEFSRLAAAASPEELPVERWRKLRGLGSLDRRRLAAVRALFEWREETAARTNRPARAIIRDDLVVEIAKRNPLRDRDLQSMRGLPRRDHGAILDVLARSRDLPIDDCPRQAEREQDPPQVPLVTSVLQAVLGDLCARRSLTPGIVTTTSELKLLVRAHMHGTPLPEDALLAQGWRREHILPDLHAVLDGRRSIRVGDLKSESPFMVEDHGTEPGNEMAGA